MLSKSCILSLIVTTTAVSSLQARTIQGRVFYASDSTAVEGASCKLQIDNKPVYATTTDAAGAFNLNAETTQAATLRIGITGCVDTDILIDAGAKSVDVGDVYLEDTNTLAEVTVNASESGSFKGRTVVFPSATTVKASSTSISLLEKLPLAGLVANPVTRTLEVQGSTPVILINGVPSTVTDFNALNPADIAKIEFSRFTPARYADSDKKGLLSITLKKRTEGGAVFAWAQSAVSTACFDATVRSSYHQGSSQFTVLYAPSWRNYQRVYDNTIEAYVADEFKVGLEQRSRTPFNYLTQSIRAQYDYSPDIKTLFSATLNIRPHTEHRRFIGTTLDTQLGEYSFLSDKTSRQINPSLDLLFKREISDKNSIEVEMVGTLSSDKYRRDNLYQFADASTNLYSQDAESRRGSLITELHWVHKFSPETSLSAGYQNTISHTRNRYIGTDNSPVLTENNNYTFVGLDQQIDKVNLTASTGAKIFVVKNDLNKRDFIRNISTLRASWDLNQKWSLTGAVEYTPQIPNLTELTDYPQQTTPYLVMNGNPALKVADIISYDLEATYRIKKFSLSYHGSLYQLFNCTANRVTYAGDHKFLSQSVNIPTGRFIYNDLEAAINGLFGFGARGRIGVSHEYLRYSDWSQCLTSLSGSINIYYNHGPFTVSYYKVFPGKTLGGEVVYKSENISSLDFDWAVDNHWDLGVAWQFMFEKKGSYYPQWNHSPVNPGYTDFSIKDNANMIMLNATYKADFGSIFKSAKRSLSNSDLESGLLKF